MSAARTLAVLVLAAATAACDGSSSAETPERREAASPHTSGATSGAPNSAPRPPASPAAPKPVRNPLAVRLWADWLAVRDATPVREMRVLCASDEEFRNACRGDWRDDVRSRLARASAVFEREFRIRFVPVDYHEWTSPPTAPDIHALQRDAAAALPTALSDLTLVFVRQDAPKGSRRDTYERGVTYYYGRTALVRTGQPAVEGRTAETDWPYEEETLLHELAHTFGAWHSRGTETVMRSFKMDVPETGFATTSSVAVVLGRTLDLDRGPDALTDAQIDTITRLWKEEASWGTEHPIADALQARGWVHEIAGRLREAAVDYERGVVLAQTHGFKPPRRLANRAWRTWIPARGDTK